VIAPRGRLLVPFLLRDAGVEVLRDQRYAEGAGRRHLLDVYRPRAGVRGAPILFQIHGGAWVIGDKRQQALPLMLHMAARGWICVAANYRLAPKATFPDPIVDLKLALRWIKEHAAELGGDPDFVTVTGGSAGGHLSALLALSAGEPAFQPGFESFDARVAACVPFYGVYDFTNRFGHDFRDGRRAFLERMLFKRRFADDPQAFEQASPLFHVHADAPPFFVVHGTHDRLVPVAEARDFVRALRERSRAPVAYAELPVAQHAFELFHSLRTRHVVDAVGRFLRFVHAEHRARGGRTQAA
jgi:acetyl esterase/lipase